MDTDVERQVRLSTAAQFRIQKDVVEKKQRSPVPNASYIANTWFGGSDPNKPLTAQERQKRVSRMLFNIARVWPYLTSQCEKVEVSTTGDLGLTTSEWRDVYTGKVGPPSVEHVCKVLGLHVALDVEPEPMELGDTAAAQADVAAESKNVTLKWAQVLEKLGPVRFGNKLLEPWTPDIVDWGAGPWRRWLIWSITELEFRSALWTLDKKIRTTHKDLPRDHGESELDRFNEVARCWGTGVLAPHEEETWLCSSDAEKRLQGVLSLREVMRLWPRTDELLPSWVQEEAQHSSLYGKTLTDETFRKLEEEVWVCYMQTYYDYYRHLPPLPFVQPARPYDLI